MDELEWSAVSHASVGHILFCKLPGRAGLSSASNPEDSVTLAGVHSVVVTCVDSLKDDSGCLDE